MILHKLVLVWVVQFIAQMAFGVRILSIAVLKGLFYQDAGPGALLS